MKFSETLKAHGALVRKVAAGTATDAERQEVLRLQAAIDAAADAVADPTHKTVTMTLAEFKVVAEKEIAELEAMPDADRLARLQRNLKAIRDQAKTAPDDVVTVEIACAAEPAIVDGLETRVAALSAAKTAPVVPDAPPAPAASDAPPAVAPAAPAAKGEPEGAFDKASVSQQLALEALEALIGRVNGLKAAVTAGTITEQQLCDAFNGWWTLRDAIETYTAIAGAAPEAAETPAAPVAASADPAAPPAVAATEVPPVAKGAPGKVNAVVDFPRRSHRDLYNDLKNGRKNVFAVHKRGTTAS